MLACSPLTRPLERSATRTNAPRQLREVNLSSLRAVPVAYNPLFPLTGPQGSKFPPESDMPATKKKQTRTRRSPEQLVADLQAKIAKIQTRAQEQKVKKDPALRHMSAAVRGIDKALKESEDKATREALNEARATLVACLALGGASTSGKATLTPRQRREKPDAEAVLAYIKQHPGSRSEEIASEVGADTAGLRAVLHQLRDDGKISVEGKARATRYAAAKV